MRRMGLWALLAGVAVVGGCKSKASPKDQLLADLRESPIIRTDGRSVFATAPGSVKIWASEARRSGVDLMAAYKSNVDDPSVRSGLAYLLLLSENLEYVEYVSAHLQEMSDDREVRVWVYVLDRYESISADYKRKLVSELSKVDKPMAQLCIGRVNVSQGQYDIAASKALRVFASGNMTWDVQAFQLLMAIPPAPRLKILQPYLETVTSLGVDVAVVLGEEAEHKERAISYLKRAAASSDQNVARKANRTLARLLAE